MVAGLRIARQRIERDRSITDFSTFLGCLMLPESSIKIWGHDAYGVK